MTVQVVQMFPPTTLTATAATLFTNQNGQPSQVLARGRIRFTNTSTSPVQVTAYDVPSGGTAGAGNLCPGLTVPALSNLDIDCPVLGYGGFIQAFASTAGVIVAHSMDGVTFS